MSTTWRPDEDAFMLEAVAACPTLREAAARMTARFQRQITKESIRKRLRTIGKRASDVMPSRRTDPAPAPEVDDESPTIPIHVDLSGLDSGGTSRVDRSNDDPVAVREKRDEATRLRSQVDDLVRRLREANARQRFIDEAAQHRAPPRIYSRERNSGIREMTPIVLASDWHVEEPVVPESVAFRNEYNLAIAAHRIERFFRAIIWNVEHHRASNRIAIRDLALWLGGDLYSGHIHPELMESNELSPTEAIRWLLPILRDGIATLRDALGLEVLWVVCSYGNHGRTTLKPRVSTGHANSFDWLLYHSLADEFRQDPRVRFEITASAHQYLDVYGHTIHFHHGDDLKYQGGVGGLGIPLLKAVPAWDRVKPADVHCIGHWHQLRDYGRAVVNGSLIGFGPYSQRIRAEFEEPQQAMFYIDRERGKAMLTSLWVSDKERVAA